MAIELYQQRLQSFSRDSAQGVRRGGSAGVGGEGGDTLG